MKIVAEYTGNDISTLESISGDGQYELRLYLVRPLLQVEIGHIQDVIGSQGILINDIKQDANILVVKFWMTPTLLAALTKGIGVEITGWQLLRTESYVGVGIALAVLIALLIRRKKWRGN